MKSKHIIVGAVAIIALVVAGFLFVMNRQSLQHEQEKEELAQLQREAMQEELANLSDEYSTQYQKLTINGAERSFGISLDSLIYQLDRERAKVNSLMQELDQVKNSNAARIAQLSHEVGSLRKLLRSYVVQIDSLHTTNERLKAENKQVQAKFEQATQEVRQLSSAKNELTAQVRLAAKLDATAIRITPMDKRGKMAKRISKIENIAVSFNVAKNVTATVGNKTFYVRIMTPMDDLLTKPNAGTFEFEGKQIPYSIQRTIEYNGEETAVQMYWAVEESLQPGSYRVAIFEGGNQIGSATFSL